MPSLLDTEFDVTLPTSLEERPEHRPAPVVVPALRLLVMGFGPIEHRLLQGTVRLSQRRSPRLDLVDERTAESADIVMIDGRDPGALQWARRHHWLARKAVIWVDAAAHAPGHTAVRRPVQWPTLPMLLARALEHGPHHAGEPVHANESPPGASVTAAPPDHHRPARRPVLVVDDSLAVRAYLRSVLESLGITVTVVESAERAIEAAAANDYGCILMDVLMPVIDGYEACRRIKARSVAGRPRTAIVMLTSKTSPFDRIRGKMAGCDAYLTKPVDPAQLHQVLAPLIAVAPVGLAPAPSAAPAPHRPPRRSRTARPRRRC